MVNLRKVSDYVHTLQPGAFRAQETEEVERLIAGCWDELNIMTDSRNMEPNKVLNRTQKLAWNPPFLSFEIERHGPTVHGSIYADVHVWTINLETGEARMTPGPRRPVKLKARPLNVRPLAQEIAATILDGKDDDRLRWKGRDFVRIEIEKVIPATNQQTTSGRRKRFRDELTGILKPRGWSATTVNCFARTR
jgi:hypothetical protein